MSKPPPMRCNELERELACFIDGELASPELREVEAHLTDCPDCRVHVQEGQALKRLLKSGQPVSAPEVLFRDVQGCLDREDGRLTWNRLAPLGKTAASILIPVAAALALVLGYVERVEPLVTESVTKHHRNLPMEVTGAPDHVRSWFRGKVPFAVQTPQLEPLASLQGGRLCNLGSREAALLQYDQHGQKLSVFVFDARGLKLNAPRRRIIQNREVYLEDTSGYQVAVFRDHGLGFAIAGTVAEPELVQLISAAVGQSP